MAADYLSTRAQVRLVIELEAGNWNVDLPVAQLIEKAKASALSTARAMMQGYDVTMIGEPRVLLVMGSEGSEVDP